MTAPRCTPTADAYLVAAARSLSAPMSLLTRTTSFAVDTSATSPVARRSRIAFRVVPLAFSAASIPVLRSEEHTSELQSH